MTVEIINVLMVVCSINITLNILIVPGIILSVCNVIIVVMCSIVALMWCNDVALMWY